TVTTRAATTQNMILITGLSPFCRGRCCFYNRLCLAFAVMGITNCAILSQSAQSSDGCGHGHRQRSLPQSSSASHFTADACEMRCVLSRSFVYSACIRASRPSWFTKRLFGGHPTVRGALFPGRRQARRASPILQATKRAHLPSTAHFGTREFP